MKELKPLKLEELTLEQKIALTICATPIIGDKEIEPLSKWQRKACSALFTPLAPSG